MSIGEYSELKRQPEAKEYRDTLAAALNRARAYDGSEAAYHELMGSLELLEEVIETSPGVAGRSPMEKEMVAALKFAPSNPKDINEVLTIASASQEKAVKKSLEGAEDGALLVHKIDKLILPFGALKLERGAGEHPFKGEAFEDRMGDLLSLLKEVGVYTDDLTVTIGATPEKTVRQVSYKLIDIPRLNRSILVCDQIGEATFVIKGSLPESILTTLDKEALQQTFPDRVFRILRRSSLQWHDDIKEALTNEAWDNKKIDLREREQGKQQIAEFIRAEYTPERWQEMTAKERATLRLSGRGLQGVGKIFDLAGNPVASSFYHLELGVMIWPENEALRETYVARAREENARTFSPDQTKELVRANSTPEQWVALRTVARREFKPDGVGMTQIASQMQFSGRPLQSTVDFLELGQKIWPESELIKNQLAIERRTPEEWREAIQKKMTPEDWRALGTQSSSRVEVDGYRITSIGSVFGIKGNVQGNTRLRLELGQKIWPEDASIRHDLEVEGWTTEEWKRRIRSELTAEQWFKMTPSMRKAYRPEDRGLSSLGTLFGIEKDPSVYASAFHELGRKIWPEAETR